MADKRAFAVFDVGYLDNPKIMDVFDASPIAVCMHFASVLYCAQHLTDGEIALRAMERKCGGTSDDSQLLIDADLWHLPGHDCPTCPDPKPGKAYVHDYLQHNRTSEGVKDKSAAGAKAAKARWEKERAEAERNAQRNAERITDDAGPQSTMQSENGQTAMPRQTEETDRKKALLKDLSKIKDEFTDWYLVYPRHEGRAKAEQAYVKARRAGVEAKTLQDAVDRYAADPNLPPTKFIPHPSSWLNGEKWLDDPLPELNPIETPARPSGTQLQLVGGYATPQRATGTSRAADILSIDTSELSNPDHAIEF